LLLLLVGLGTGGQGRRGGARAAVLLHRSSHHPDLYNYYFKFLKKLKKLFFIK
jgi:hypothetical protein